MEVDRERCDKPGPSPPAKRIQKAQWLAESAGDKVVAHVIIHHSLVNTLFALQGALVMYQQCPICKGPKIENLFLVKKKFP